MKNYSHITLNKLELSVNLGWPQGERIKPQIVVLDVVIRFATPPLACTTDQLSDSYGCYDKLISVIKNYIADKNFRLLEHLGYELHQIITQTLAPGALIQVCVTKKPAILNLTGGVTFCYGNEE